MKNFLTNLFLALGLLLSTAGFAQVIVKGKVVDRTDFPLAGASVVIKVLLKVLLLMPMVLSLFRQQKQGMWI